MKEVTRYFYVFLMLFFGLGCDQPTTRLPLPQVLYGSVYIKCERPPHLLNLDHLIATCTSEESLAALESSQQIIGCTMEEGSVDPEDAGGGGPVSTRPADRRTHCRLYQCFLRIQGRSHPALLPAQPVRWRLSARRTVLARLLSTISNVMEGCSRVQSTTPRLQLKRTLQSLWFCT